MLDEKSNNCGAFLMTKYSSDFKAKVVNRYLKGDISYNALCTMFKIPDARPVRDWVKRAEIHGLNSLKVTHIRKEYTQDFKLAVVEYVHTHQVSRAQTAAHFGISASQVNSWDRIIRKQGVAGLRPTHKGGPSAMGKHKRIKPIKRLKPTQEEKYKQEILELKQRLHEAELDRDILKTLAILTKKSPKSSPRK